MNKSTVNERLISKGKLSPDITNRSLDKVFDIKSKVKK